MVLSSKEAANFIVESNFSKRAQQGIDLSIQRIKEIQPGGIISIDSSFIPAYNEIFPDEDGFFTLEAGKVYDLVFNEKVRLDNQHGALVIQRSSLSRSGILLCHKSWFDSGFSTKEEFIGTTATCFCEGKIEKNARVAQMLIFKTEESEAYNGQYFGEKQRTERNL